MQYPGDSDNFWRSQRRPGWSVQSTARSAFNLASIATATAVGTALVSSYASPSLGSNASHWSAALSNTAQSVLPYTETAMAAGLLALGVTKLCSSGVPKTVGRSIVNGVRSGAGTVRGAGKHSLDTARRLRLQRPITLEPKA